MKSEPDNALPEISRPTDSARPITSTVRVLLWVCVAMWAISFFLPAAIIDRAKPASGCEVAYEAVVLILIPLKGAWLGILPPVWTVFINVFMLLVPVEIKAIGQGEGRVFAVLFSTATALPVFLAYLPPSLGLFGLALPLLAGFYVWEFSMIMAAALFVRTLWKSNWSPAPAAFLTVLLLLLPIRRSEWTFEPEQPKQATVAPQSRNLQIETYENARPTTIVVESSPNPSLNGEEVTFSLRVSGPWGPIPNGTVSLTDVVGDKTIGRVHTAGGTATISTSTLSVGEHPMRVNFAPDESDLYLSSEGSLVHIVEHSQGRRRGENYQR